MFTAGYKLVTGLTSLQYIGHVTKIIYARTIRNIGEKNRCRVINRSVFISSDDICVRIRALHFYAGFCRRVESLRRSARRYGNAKIFLRARGTNARRISES